MVHDERQATSGDVSIVEFGRAQVGGVATAHIASFPGYLLSEMGRKWVEHYYQALLDSGLAVGCVAITPDQGVVGIAIGSADLDGFQRYLYRHKLPRLAWTLLTGYAVDSSVRHLVNRRLREIPHHLRILLVPPRDSEEAAETAASVEEQPDAARCYIGTTLMSMAVVPERRGSRVARSLVDAFELSAREGGAQAVRLSVETSNVRAIRFYEKCGYRLCLNRGAGLDYRKPLNGSTRE